jgi:hypothetical protein
MVDNAIESAKEISRLEEIAKRVSILEQEVKTNKQEISKNKQEISKNKQEVIHLTFSRHSNFYAIVLIKIINTFKN